MQAQIYIVHTKLRQITNDRAKNTQIIGTVLIPYADEQDRVDLRSLLD